MNDDEYMSRVLGMERKLYRIAHSLLWNDADCADAIQEAITKGWMKKATLREVCFFETWLVRILINECRNIQRREKIRLLPLDEGIKVQREEDFVENLLSLIHISPGPAGSADWGWRCPAQAG